MFVAPTRAPGGVTASAISTSVRVSWNAIECIERNGVISTYIVEFEDLSGAAVRGEVRDQTFTASGLTPHTTYSFRVAGNNSIGLGPFSKSMNIATDQDGKYDTRLIVMSTNSQSIIG